MKSATNLILEELRALCLKNPAKTMVLVSQGLSAWEEMDGDPEGGDALRSIAGYQWKIIGENGEDLGTSNEYPIEGVENDIETIEPTTGTFTSHLETLEPRRLAVLLGTLVSLSVGVDQLMLNMENFGRWAPKIKEALGNSLK